VGGLAELCHKYVMCGQYKLNISPSDQYFLLCSLKVFSIGSVCGQEWCIEVEYSTGTLEDLTNSL
jgi:hypothetical protein